MNRPADELKRMLERFDAVIRAAGVKRTPQRLEIYREAARTADHPSLEMIHRNVRKRMPTISLDTVYRTLSLLRELGLVRTVSPHPDRVRFDANLSPHHHFVCTACGLTRDFHDPALDALSIPSSARAFGSVESAQLEVRGQCQACAGGKKAATTGTRSHRLINRSTRRD
jgi:Fur family peroxide stress response transcriptional regulator